MSAQSEKLPHTQTSQEQRYYERWHDLHVQFLQKQEMLPLTICTVDFNFIFDLSIEKVDKC